MRAASSFSRPLALALLAVAVVGVSGCKWFRKGSPEYSMSQETRPLEVPPDLNLPNSAGAMQLPATSSQLASQAAPAVVASTTSFHVAGSREDVFNRLGVALGEVEGLTIASRAQLLGTYDVSYEGSNFLVRVTVVDTGVYVSVVDPRGTPAQGTGPAKLITTLKAKLGG